MDKLLFLSLFNKLINYIVHEIEKQDKYNTIDFDFDAESLTLNKDMGVFVINRQVPAREIWFSSPQIGPKHFRCRSDGSFFTHDGSEMFDVFSKDLSIQMSKEAFNLYES